MTNEIILTPYQSTVFNAAEALLRTQGYLGEALFEDTYVLSKKLAQYVQSSIPQSNGTVSVNAMMAYNYVLGVVVTPPATTGTNPPPPVPGRAALPTSPANPTPVSATQGNPVEGLPVGTPTTNPAAGRAVPSAATAPPPATAAPFGSSNG